LTFVRFHIGEELKQGEKLLRYRSKKTETITGRIFNDINIVPDSFLFQEGHARYYRNAEYGVFKFDDVGHSILIGLAKNDRQLITPPSSSAKK
jgi:uncharacterized membrane-anchored protein